MNKKSSYFDIFCLKFLQQNMVKIFLTPPLKSASCPSPSFLSNPPYWFFVTLKVGFFSEPPKYQSFSSFTSSYLLKVTKFLVKIYSQFEFLVMTEKSIFAYKLFLSLNISDFSLFSCENWNPPWKKSPPSFPATPSKIWGPVKSPLFENLVGASTPLAERWGGYPICTQFKNKFQWAYDRVVSFDLH